MRLRGKMFVHRGLQSLAACLTLLLLSPTPACKKAPGICQAA